MHMQSVEINATQKLTIEDPVVTFEYISTEPAIRAPDLANVIMPPKELTMMPMPNTFVDLGFAVRMSMPSTIWPIEPRSGRNLAILKISMSKESMY
jgi:hypothetical protein